MHCFQTLILSFSVLLQYWQCHERYLWWKLYQRPSILHCSAKCLSYNYYDDIEVANFLRSKIRRTQVRQCIKQAFFSVKIDKKYYRVTISCVTSDQWFSQTSNHSCDCCGKNKWFIHYYCNDALLKPFIDQVILLGRVLQLVWFIYRCLIKTKQF